MPTITHLTTEQLHAGLEEIERAPKLEGVLELIVRRPAVDAREVLQEGELDIVEGLVGDTWSQRGSSRSADGRAHPEMQLNVMNARAAALVAQHPDRWPLAGDQLYRRSRPEQREPAGGHAPGHRHGGHRSHAAAAHRLQQVRRAGSDSTR